MHFTEDMLFSAESGEAEAQYELALCYAHGYGINQNKSEAIKWFREATKQGYSPAKQYLQNSEPETPEKKKQVSDLSISNEVISKMLDDIRIKLLDLSKRNRLLNYKRNKLSIVIVDEQPRQVFQRIVNDGKPMTFVPLPEPDLEDIEPNLLEEQIRTKEQLIIKAGKLAGIDIREELPHPSDHETGIPTKHTDKFLQTKLFMPELETRLRRIRSNAHSLIEETGQNQLYLALGFLQWKERIDTEDKYEAPLILVPVEVERGKIDTNTRCYSYNIKYTGEDLLRNLSLAEKLKNDFDLILPSFEDRQVVQNINGDYELDPEAYFDTVLETISNMKGWTISRKMVLGFFTFSKLLMYLDLDPQRWPNSSISKHPLIVGLLEGYTPSSSGFNDKDELDEETIIDFLRLVIDAELFPVSRSGTG